MSTVLRPGRTPEVISSALTARFDFSTLRRWLGEPAGQGPHPRQIEVQAYDAADLLLLDTAAAWFDAGHPRGDVVVLDDNWGALSLPLLHDAQEAHDAQTSTLRTAQDGIVAERALHSNARRLGLSGPVPEEISPAVMEGASTVLMVLPRSLETLADWTWLVAEHGADDVVLLAGGRNKHMTPAMNDVLGRHFEDVVPGLGRSKSRVLTARTPRRGLPAPGPRCSAHDAEDLGLQQPLRLCHTGATYGGTKLDPGTRLLLQTIEADPRFTVMLEHAGRAVDLGCGNGSVSVVLARRHPQLRVLAADQSASAVESTRLTAQANGVVDQIELLRDDALGSLPDASEQLILLNPPFHQGHAVDTATAHRLMDDAGRVLTPGGRLYCVWNSHLRHRPALERSVGPTEQLARNQKFTVTASQKPH